MFSKIWNYLVNVEQTVEHDVEAIISTFTNTVAKLEAAAVSKTAEAAEHFAASDAHEQLAAEATAAASKATAVAAKIKELVA
jgi:hypothetical protein